MTESVATAAAPGVYVTPTAARKVFSAVSVPDRVSAAGVPPTATPPPAVADSAPASTASVRVTFPLPASGSATEMPVRTSGVSSKTVIDAGTVTDGASFTAAMVMVNVWSTEVTPSETVRVTVWSPTSAFVGVPVRMAEAAGVPLPVTFSVSHAGTTVPVIVRLWLVGSTSATVTP